MMIYFKACPKCHGDMHLVEDSLGDYRKCFQCGYILVLDAQELPSEKAVAQRRAA